VEPEKTADVSVDMRDFFGGTASNAPNMEFLVLSYVFRTYAVGIVQNPTLSEDNVGF
jgi:hypothetical protein